MKIKTSLHTLAYDLANHMQSKGLHDETVGYLRFLLEDNIPVHIKVNGRLYESPWRYWKRFTSDFASCCGAYDNEIIESLRVSEKELLRNSIEIKDTALDYWTIP